MNLLKFLCLNLFLILIVLSNTACIEQKAKQSDLSPNAPAENPGAAGEEIAAALDLIERKPDAADGYNHLAVAYIRKARETGDFSLNVKAETALDRALEIKPSDMTARKLRASLYLTFHRFNEALERGKKLEQESPDDAFVYGILTDANVELGNYEEAILAGQKMVDLKPNAVSYARAGHLRSLLGDHDGAVEMMKLAARTASPRDKEAQSWNLVRLGDELMKYGKYDRAEKVFDEALQNLPDYYMAIAGKGRARAAQGDFAEALKLLTDANNRVPDVENQILIGDIYTKQGDAEKARQQYDLVEIIERKMGSGDDQKRLALLWADHDVKLDEALEIARRENALRKDIYTADALAWVLYKKGEFPEAKKAAAEAMRLKTDDARILYHAGMIEKQLGNTKEAKKLLQTALKLNPNFDILQSEIAKNILKELS